MSLSVLTAAIAAVLGALPFVEPTAFMCPPAVAHARKIAQVPLALAGVCALGARCRPPTVVDHPIARSGAGLANANAFAYANGNPATLVDPSGLLATTDGDGGACMDHTCETSRAYSQETENAMNGSLGLGSQMAQLNAGGHLPDKTPPDFSIVTFGGPVGVSVGTDRAGRRYIGLNLSTSPSVAVTAMEYRMSGQRSTTTNCSNTSDV